MFDSVLARARSASGSLAVSTESFGDWARDVPSKYLWAELASLAAAPPDKWSPQEIVLALLACIKHSDRIAAVPGDETSRQFLVDSLGDLVLPPPAGELAAEDSSSVHAATAEACLCLFVTIGQEWQTIFSPSTLLLVAAYTDSRDPWTTEHSRVYAASIVSQQPAPGSSASRAFIVETVLEGFLRPIFSSQAPRYITPGGRPAFYPEGPDRSRRQDSVKPWKRSHPHAATVFTWAVEHSEESLLSQHWPLFMPPMLTLLEDIDIDVKIAALSSLALVMGKCKREVLQASGLLGVFREAIFPCLDLLPSLTPEDQSARVLDQSYQALMVLAGLSRAEDVPTLLDRILRDGILTGYFHAGEYPNVAEVLLRNCSRVVSALRLRTAKHLKELIPVYSRILANPASLHHQKSLLTTIDALRSTIVAAWPRIYPGRYYHDIMEALSLCWLNLRDPEETEVGETGEAEAQLRQVWALVNAVVRNDDEFLSETSSSLMATKEPGLQPLVGSGRV